MTEQTAQAGGDATESGQTQPGDNGGEMSKDLFLFHVGRIEQMEKRIAEEKAILKKYKKQATSDGIVMKDLNQVLKMRGLAHDTNVATLERRQQYMQFLEMPAGFQFELFEQPQRDKTAKGAAYTEGRTAGVMAVVTAAENPYRDASSDEAQAWLDGFGDGGKARKAIAQQYTVSEVDAEAA